MEIFDHLSGRVYSIAKMKRMNQSIRSLNTNIVLRNNFNMYAPLHIQLEEQECNVLLP